jgi:glycosyltransferase involved in cell wall biosynthesis
MTEIPEVSVVIPAWNAAWCVGRAIDSALAQTFSAREILVVDDGSSDDTPAVLAAYGTRIRVIRQQNAGLSRARNAGIAAARGRYVALLDADDWWLPSKLARQVALFEADPALVFCSTATELQDEQGQVLNTWACGNCRGPVLEAIFAHNAYVAGSGSAVMVRRDIVTEAGGFDPALASLEDIDMWMRLAARGSYACVPEVQTVVFRRAGSMSGNFRVMRASAMAVMCKNRALLPAARRGHFWRQCYAGVLSDYAKWAYRHRCPGLAVRDALFGLALAPVSHGRLLLGLLRDIALGRPV